MLWKNQSLRQEREQGSNEIEVTVRCRGRNTYWAAGWLRVAFRTESGVRHTEVNIVTEQPKAEDRQSTRGEQEEMIPEDRGCPL